MLSLLGYGKGSILSSDLSLFSADRQSSSCLAQLTEDEFAYLKTEVFQLEPESWLYKGTVYPEKQSIHRPVMLVVRSLELWFLSSGKGFMDCLGIVYARYFIKWADLLRMFKVDSHDGLIDWKTEKGREVYAVCGWHHICAAWLWHRATGAKTTRLGLGVGLASQASASSRKRSHMQMMVY